MQMCKTVDDFYKVKNDSDKELISKTINIIDKKIDQAIYNLYGLSKEQIIAIEKE